jgi:hypothetical protein
MMKDMGGILDFQVLNPWKCTHIPVTYVPVVRNWRALPLQEFDWKVKK